MNNFKNGEILTVKVADLGYNGEGVVKIDGFPIFVPFVLPDELVKIKINYVTKDYAFATVLEILEQSKFRIKPKCPYFANCGGCDIQHANPELQATFKKNIILNNLKKIAGLDIQINDTVVLNEWEYRNKLSLPFGYIKGSKRVVLGFYEKRSHNVVGLNWCPLHADWSQKLIKTVSTWATDNNIPVYDEQTGKGLLRHLVARFIDNLSAVLVINGDNLPYLDSLISALSENFVDFSIYISKNTKVTNVIFGDTVRLVYGKEQEQNLGGIKAAISPLSFLQVNNKVKDAIYDAVCENLASFDGDIIELYSGVGLLTAQIAYRLKNANITAVEIVKDGTENANVLMKNCGFDNRVKNICDDALNFMSEIDLDRTKQNCASRSGSENNQVMSKIEINNSERQNATTQDLFTRNNFLLENADDSMQDNTLQTKNINDGLSNKKYALILDPPRKGCEKEILEKAIEKQFSRIIYISCNPSTLCRDLKILKPYYDVVSVTPYDMFPQTRHVETLICLSKKS